MSWTTRLWQYIRGGSQSTMGDGFGFSTLNSEIIWTHFEENGDYREVLNKCSVLASVIFSRADAFAMGDVQVLNRRTQNDVRGVNKEWQSVIDKPNFMQTKSQFLKQLHCYVDLMGWCYALPMYPAGMPDRPYAIWLLPPWMMEVQAIRKPFYSFTSGEAVREVYFNYNGYRQKLDEKNLILFTDSNSLICEQTWLPEGRLKNLEYPITKLISAEEAGVTLIQKRGAIGIFSNDTGKGELGYHPITNDDKKDIQEDFRRYGLTRNQWQVIITNASLKWQSTAFDVKQLGLSDNYLQAVKDICDVYNYPFPLSSHSDQSTYNNVSTADRLLYQNSIIPESRVLFEQLNAGLKTPEQNVEILIDYQKVPALQATEKEKADAMISQNNAMQSLYKNNMITKNQWLEFIGWNKIQDPEFDKYYSQTAEGIAAQNAATNGAA